MAAKSFRIAAGGSSLNFLPPPPNPAVPMQTAVWQHWFDLVRTFINQFTPSHYPVVSLPTNAYEGQFAYAEDGRKVWEGAGAGTGVPVYFSQGSWRVFSTDAVVST